MRKVKRYFYLHLVFALEIASVKDSFTSRQIYKKNPSLFAWQTAMDLKPLLHYNSDGSLDLVNRTSSLLLIAMLLNLVKDWLYLRVLLYHCSAECWITSYLFA